MKTTTSIRLVKEEDFDRVTEIVAEAFLHDPVYSYFASLREVSRWKCFSTRTPLNFALFFQQLIPKDGESKEKENLRKWGRFLLLSCLASGGRVTVIVEHADSPSETSERVVGFANWFPPNKRLALWHVRTLFKAGLVGMLRAWGLSGLIVGCHLLWESCQRVPLIGCIWLAYWVWVSGRST